MSTTDVTRAEVCAAAVADAFADDGELFGSPMGTMPSLGARLAKLTSNPDLVISNGESLYLAGVPPLGEQADVVEGWIPFRLVFQVIGYGRRHVMMGASQIDKHGNQNISAIGDFAQPKTQLLGTRGAPGNTVNHRTSYWVPRHTARVFVDQVDIVCGVGPKRAKEAGVGASKYNDIHRIITDLAVMDVKGPDDTVRLLSVHPGVSVEQVQEATGFELALATDAAGNVATTRVPSESELLIIRTMLDPRNFRDREVPPVEAKA